MRDIKFRQAIYCDEKFHHWHYWGFLPDLSFVGVDSINGLAHARANSGQYIGLKDKDGVEIWEGDIVKVRNNKCQLQVLEVIGRVTERYAAWGVTDLKIIKFEKYSTKTKPHSATDIMYFLNIFDCKRIKVIGNIHQNPELLT